MKRIITAVAVLVSLAAGSLALAENANRGEPRQKTSQSCTGQCSGCAARAPEGLTDRELFTP